MTQRDAKKATQTNDKDIDVESMAAIRSLLHADVPERAAPSDAPKRSRRFAAMVDEPAPEDVSAPQSTREKALKKAPRIKTQSPDGQGNFLMRILGQKYAQYAVLAVAVLLTIYFRPFLILGIMFLSTLTVAAIFLILGYDGFWQRTMAVARWYARRSPERAVVLHRKLDLFATKWDAILDRFPEGTVDSLYLPDIGDVGQPGAQQDAATDRRFSQMREG
jgi:hypothetical protein